MNTDEQKELLNVFYSTATLKQKNKVSAEIKKIAETCNVLHKLFSKEFSYNDKTVKETNVYEIAPWIKKRISAVKATRYDNIEKFLSDTTTLLGFITTITNKNLFHLKKNDKILNHLKELYNMLLGETGMMFVINDIISWLDKEKTQKEN